MTSFELLYLLTEPFLPPLQRLVRKQLIALSRSVSPPPSLLDVGGRKSHYTIGVPAHITISDLPRASAVQNQLNLGITNDIARQTLGRRSNVADVVYDDMTCSKLSEGSFDLVVAVEVLEHVTEDAIFIQNVARVLKPGGWFIMTTPNGDAVPIPHNADHKRHYRRDQLIRLLEQVMDAVDVTYCVRAGRYRTWGLKSWSLRQPFQTVRSMVGNVINSAESASPEVRNQAYKTRHLLAVARKGAGMRG